MKKSSSLNRNMAWIGIALGVMFPLFSILLDIYFKGLPFTTSSVATLFNQNQIQWIVLSAPLVLGGVFYSLGKIIRMREDQLNASLENGKQQLSVLTDMIKHFDDKAHQANQEVGNSEILDILSDFKKKYHKNHEEEARQSWTNEGLARLADLLRNQEDINSLCKSILTYLVKYTRFSYGVFFVPEKNGDEQYLELKAGYAIDPNRITGRIEISNDIIGQSFSTRKKILLHEFPDNFIRISSGLGTATPTELIVLPIFNNKGTEGVIEMAGFHTLQQHELDFLDKVAESVANALYTMRINTAMKQRLGDHNGAGKEVREKDEAFRQMVDELANLQDEFSRKETEYAIRIQRLEQTNAELKRENLNYQSKITQERVTKGG